MILLPIGVRMGVAEHWEGTFVSAKVLTLANSFRVVTSDVPLLTGYLANLSENICWIIDRKRVLGSL